MAYGIVPDLSIDLKNNLEVCLYIGDIFSVAADGLAFTENGVIARKLDEETDKKFTKKLKHTMNFHKICKMEACGGILGFKMFLVAKIDLYSSKMSEEWKKDLQKLYENVLREAEKEKFKSLTLSVFGTGLAGGRGGGDCINILTKSLLHHKPRTLTKVNIVSKSMSIISSIGNELAQHSQRQRVDKSGKPWNSSSNKRGDNSQKTSNSRVASTSTDETGNRRDSKRDVRNNIEKEYVNIEKNRKRSDTLITKSRCNTKEETLPTNSARVNYESETSKEREKPGSNLGRRSQEQRYHDTNDSDEGISVDPQLGEKNKFHSSGPTAGSCSGKISNCHQWNPDSGRRQSDTDDFHRSSRHLSMNRGKIRNDAGMNGCLYKEPEDSVRGGCHRSVSEDVNGAQRSENRNLENCPHCNSLTKTSFEDHCGHTVCSDCIRSSRKCPDDPNQSPSDWRQIENDSDSEDGEIQDVLVNDLLQKATCPICMDEVRDPKQLDQCGHVFCERCIQDCFLRHKPVCPCCGAIYDILTGCQPTGTMEIMKSYGSLYGFDSNEHWEISYDLPSGLQKEGDPYPGKPYHGTKRVAYLPVTRDGNLVLKLLVVAFQRGLIFTIGRSTTTGKEDTVTWNDIHHKTSKYGGPARFGYPDPGYLTRVTEELRSKGVTEQSTAEIRLSRYQTFRV